MLGWRHDYLWANRFRKLPKTTELIMRRSHLPKLIEAASVLALIVTTMTSSAAKAQGKPNVVIMLGDNVGYGDIGAYGAGEIRGMPTPH